MANELLERDKIDEYLSNLSGWKSVENHHIIKEFNLPDLKLAANFIENVEEIGDKLNHHADIIFNLGQVEIKIYTHSVDGLTIKDFSLAIEIEKVYSTFSSY